MEEGRSHGLLDALTRAFVRDGGEVGVAHAEHVQHEIVSPFVEIGAEDVDALGGECT